MLSFDVAACVAASVSGCGRSGEFALHGDAFVSVLEGFEPVLIDSVLGGEAADDLEPDIAVRAAGRGR